MLTLKIVQGSPNCRKALAVAHHLGFDVDIQGLDFLAGDLKAPDFVALNPNAMVPVMMDGDFVLWESNAIMQYLCDKKPGNTLLPTDARKRSDVMRWVHWSQAHFNRATETFLFENVLKPLFFKQPTDGAKVAEAQESFKRFAPVLDNQLQARKFVTGENVTIPDFALAAPLAYADMMQLPWQPYANIQAWYQRVEKLPAWQKSTPPKLAAA